MSEDIPDCVDYRRGKKTGEDPFTDLRPHPSDLRRWHAGMLEVRLPYWQPLQVVYSLRYMTIEVAVGKHNFRAIGTYRIRERSARPQRFDIQLDDFN